MEDLEIKDAPIIFDKVWNELTSDAKEEDLHFPSEIFWVNGAPGAGKGTHTATMMKFRDFTAPPIVMSGLLQSPEAVLRKQSGQLVGDTEVCTLLLKRLLDEEYSTGAVVDGFPRTMVQVEFLKLFHAKLNEISETSINEAGVRKIRKPNFHILVLFVDEEESVRRQLGRGQQAIDHNREVAASGIGDPVEVRLTDLDPIKARNRYRVFKEQTYEPLKSLRQIFHFHFINTHATIEECRLRILREMEYQSSLELSQETFERLSSIPVASTIVQHARPDLVERLEEYERTDPRLFQEVIKIIEEKMMPIIRRHAISGRAYINSEDRIFQNDRALSILIDVFSERGYHAVVDIRQESVPCHVDRDTFEIKTRIKLVYRIVVFFKGSEIRRGR